MFDPGPQRALEAELNACYLRGRHVECIKVVDTALAGSIVALPCDASPGWAYEILVHPDDWATVIAPYWDCLRAYAASRGEELPEDPPAPGVDGLLFMGIPVQDG